MRTTLTLDPDVAQALRQRAHEGHRSFKDIVNEAIRAGLAHGQQPRRRAYRLKVQHLGGVRRGVNVDKALQLAAVLEDIEIVRNLELRK